MPLLNHKTKSKALAIVIILGVVALLVSMLCNAWNRHYRLCDYVFEFPESRAFTRDAALSAAWEVIWKEGYSGMTFDKMEPDGEPWFNDHYKEHYYRLYFSCDRDGRRRTYWVAVSRSGDKIKARGAFNP